MIKLIEVNKNNLYKCLALDIDDSQKGFLVEGVAISLAKAWVWYEKSYPFAIYNDDELVGFILMCKGVFTDANFIGMAEDDPLIWEFMIDKKYQGKGYGRAAIQCAINWLKKIHNAKKIFTSVHEENKIAINLYKSFGFEFTGGRDDSDGEIDMFLIL